MHALRLRKRRFLRAAALGALLGLLLHLGIMASPAHAAAAANTTGHLGTHAGRADTVDTTGAVHGSGPSHMSPPVRSSVPASALAAGDADSEGAGTPALADHPGPGVMPDDCAISPAPARGIPPFAPPGERLVLAPLDLRPLASVPLTRRPAARPPPGGAQAFLQVFLI